MKFALGDTNASLEQAVIPTVRLGQRLRLSCNSVEAGQGWGTRILSLSLAIAGCLTSGGHRFYGDPTNPAFSHFGILFSLKPLHGPHVSTNQLRVPFWLLIAEHYEQSLGSSSIVSLKLRWD